MSDRIQGVIFDFGNVLGLFDKLRACKRLARSTEKYGAQDILTLVSDRLEKPLESGAMSETAFANELLHLIGSDLTVPDVLRIWGNIFTENGAIVSHVDKLLARGIRIGVLSNTSGIHVPYFTDLQVMQTLARNRVPHTYSHQEGMLKPDPRIFRTALRRIGLEAPNVLYIDDIVEHVVAARSIGMRSVQYDAKQHSALDLREKLEHYRLFV